MPQRIFLGHLQTMFGLLDSVSKEPCPPIFLSVHPYFYPSPHISTRPPIFLPVHPYFYPSTHISTRSPIFLPVHPYFYPSTHIAARPPIFLPVHPYFYPSTHISTRPPIFLLSSACFTDKYDGWMGLCIKLCQGMNCEEESIMELWNN